MIIALIYIVLGYWATGKTIYEDAIMFGTASGIFIQRCCVGAILGWALIPIAIIKCLMGK